MAGLRKASAYSKRKARPYTRKSKKKQKSYIKTIPQTNVVKMHMGDAVGFRDNKYPIKLSVVSKEKVQVRDNSIEAVRQYLNRFLLLKIGKEYYFEIKIYPHHILRENKMLTGAGSDRMQTGMSQSFGKTMGRAAFVKPKQEILFIAVQNKKHEADARQLIASVKSRMPCKVSVQTEILKK